MPCSKAWCQFPVGQPVDLLLELSAKRLVRVRAIVVRASVENRPSFGIAFDEFANGAREVVHAAALQSLAALRRASVLVVYNDDDAARSLRKRVERLGHRAVAVTTTTEAAHCLEAENRICVALVDPFLDVDRGRALLLYLAEKHPAVRRVLIVETAILPLEQPISASHEILLKPWTDEDLERALTA